MPFDEGLKNKSTSQFTIYKFEIENIELKS